MDVSFPDASTKLNIYRLVFDVIYRERAFTIIFNSHINACVCIYVRIDRDVIEELLIESNFYSRNCHVSY